MTSALILALPAGSYTAQISGANATAGIALAEIYGSGGEPRDSLPLW